MGILIIATYVNVEGSKSSFISCFSCSFEIYMQIYRSSSLSMQKTGRTWWSLLLLSWLFSHFFLWVFLLLFFILFLLIASNLLFKTWPKQLRIWIWQRKWLWSQVNFEYDLQVKFWQISPLLLSSCTTL